MRERSIYKLKIYQPCKVLTAIKWFLNTPDWRKVEIHEHFEKEEMLKRRKEWKARNN